MGLTYTQIWSKMQILEVYAEFESFWYIARDYESAAEATSLLSSVASLAIKYILNQVNPAVNQRIYFTVEFQELLHQFRETRLNIHSLSNAFTKTWLFILHEIEFPHLVLHASLLVLHH